VRLETLLYSKFVYGIVIRQDDRVSLLAGGWYTDAVMEVRLAWLQQQYSRRVMFFTAWECTMLSGAFSAHARQCTRLSQQVVVANPEVVVFLRHGGYHWWCEIYDTRTKILKIVNTLGKCQEYLYVGESAFNTMSAIFKILFVHVPCKVIQQENGNTVDCGPLILWTLDPRSCGKESLLAPCDVVNIMRAEVANRPYVNFLEVTSNKTGLQAVRAAVFKNA
jgi:hypothetical protein